MAHVRFAAKSAPRTRSLRVRFGPILLKKSIFSTASVISGLMHCSKFRLGVRLKIRLTIIFRNGRIAGDQIVQARSRGSTLSRRAEAAYDCSCYRGFWVPEE